MRGPVGDRVTENHTLTHIGRAAAAGVCTRGTIAYARWKEEELSFQEPSTSSRTHDALGHSGSKRGANHGGSGHTEGASQ